MHLLKYSLNEVTCCFWQWGSSVLWWLLNELHLHCGVCVLHFAEGNDSNLIDFISLFLLFIFEI